jgi:two-component system, OmpR family, sensor kinase
LVTGISQAEVERARLLEPRCSVTLSGWEVIIPVDSGKVAAIIRNLLDNALHAAGPGGGIVVALKVEGDQAVLYVADSCPGVPAADWERIFERLIRLDDTRSTDSGGSGLGLAIARGYARAHGGELTCAEPDAAPPCRHRQPYRRSLPPEPSHPPAGPALSTTRQSAREPFICCGIYGSK